MVDAAWANSTQAFNARVLMAPLGTNGNESTRSAAMQSIHCLTGETNTYFALQNFTSQLSQHVHLDAVTIREGGLNGNPFVVTRVMLQ